MRLFVVSLPIIPCLHLFLGFISFTQSRHAVVRVGAGVPSNGFLLAAEPPHPLHCRLIKDAAGSAFPP